EWRRQALLALAQSSNYTYMPTSERRRDPVTGGSRWDLPGGRYILADSSIGGGGCCVRRPSGAIEIYGTDRVAELIGPEHEAVDECRYLTGVARQCQQLEGL